MMDNAFKLVSVKEIAAAAEVSESTVRAWLRQTGRRPIAAHGATQLYVSTTTMVFKMDREAGKTL